MCGGKNIRCRKEDKLPREMQRGAYKARSSNGSGYHTFHVMMPVRIRYGLQGSLV
jgi:hypothetical protein